MGGKKGWFSAERFLFYFDHKLKKGGQKSQKRAVEISQKLFQNFLQIPASKTSESRLLASSGFSAPPPPSRTLPPLCFLRPA
jgi:hypothetical protein